MKVLARNGRPELMRLVYIVLTRACNLSCPFCVRGRSTGSAEHMSVSEAESVLRQVKDLFPEATVCLSGGEPTLHPEIIQIVSMARRLFSSVSIVSNGTRPEKIKELSLSPGLKYQISLDGTEPVHNRLRGQGSFKQTVESIRILIERGQPLTVSTTASEDNVEDLGPTFDLLRQLGCTRWKVSQEVPGGDAYQRTDRHIHPHRWNAVINHLRKLTADWSGTLLSKTQFTFVGKNVDLDGASPVELERMSCQAGIDRVYIYPDLSVIGCPLLIDHPLGNLNESSLSQVFDGRARESLLNLGFPEGSPCHDCRWLSVCWGGCIGAALARTGSLGGGDPACPCVCTSWT